MVCYFHYHWCSVVPFQSFGMVSFWHLFLSVSAQNQWQNWKLLMSYPCGSVEFTAKLSENPVVENFCWVFLCASVRTPKLERPNILIIIVREINAEAYCLLCVFVWFCFVGLFWGCVCVWFWCLGFLIHCQVVTQWYQYVFFPLCFPPCLSRLWTFHGRTVLLTRSYVLSRHKAISVALCLL